MSVWDDIYQDHAWGGETESGPGASIESTRSIARHLRHLFAWWKPHRVLDAGCGVYHWQRCIQVPYVGVDVVEALVRRNQRDHAASMHRLGYRGTSTYPEVEFLHADIRYDWLPPAEVVLIKDTMTHMSLVSGRRTLENVRRTGATWLIATTFDDGTNVDVADGDYYRTDLRAEPFALGKPWAVLDDTMYDAAKALGVWALA